MVWGEVPSGMRVTMGSSGYKFCIFHVGERCPLGPRVLRGKMGITHGEFHIYTSYLWCSGEVPPGTRWIRGSFTYTLCICGVEQRWSPGTRGTSVTCRYTLCNCGVGERYHPGTWGTRVTFAEYCVYVVRARDTPRERSEGDKED